MKKKIICLFLAVVMLLGMMSVLAACGGDEVCEHVDADANGACDKCGEPVEVAECEHADGNLDGVCDACGESMGTSGSCRHEDFDDDNICDECGADMTQKVVMKPVWNSQTIKIVLNKSDNHAELSSELERYVAGEGSYQKEVDRAVDRRNIKAVQETKVTPYADSEHAYEYWDNIAENDWGKSIDKIRDTVTSTTIKNAPDVYSTFIYDLVGASVQGLFANLKGTSRGDGDLKGLNYFEFVYDKKAYEAEYKATGEDRGFMYEWMESVTLAQDKMYVLASDYFVDMVRAFFMIPVNVEILESVVEDITGDRNGDEEYTIDDFYEQVKAGEWTYDVLMEYADAVDQDDGNPDTTDEWLGDDVVGFAMAAGGVANSGIIYTTSVTVIHKDWNPTRNDYDYSYPEVNEPLYDLSIAINRLLSAEGVVYVKNPSDYKNSAYSGISEFGESHLTAIRQRFSLGHVLFGDIMMVGALEFNAYQSMGEGAFGVVPVPIYHENIDEETGEPIDKYLTQIHNVGRPGAIAYNTKKFVECTAYLNFQSTNSTDILNDYYTYELCYGAAGGAQGTVEMLEYLRANVRTSFDKAMEDAMGVFDATSTDYKITYLLSNNSFNVPDISTKYSNAVPVKKGHLSALIDYFKAAKD